MIPLTFIVPFSFFIEIDECTSGTHNCHSSLASCTNTAGSFSCTCNSPYLGDGRSCYIPSGDNSPNITGRCPFTKPFFTLVRGALFRGGIFKQIFAGYVPLASQSRYALIVYSVTNYRLLNPSQSLLGKYVIFAIPTQSLSIFMN